MDLLTKEVRTLLLEIGLMGYSGGFELEALDYFNKLHLIDPDNPHISLFLAHLYFFNRDFEQGEQILLELEISPAGSDPWVSQMVHLFRQSGIQFSRISDIKN